MGKRPRRNRVPALQIVWQPRKWLRQRPLLRLRTALTRSRHSGTPSRNKNVLGPNMRKTPQRDCLHCERTIEKPRADQLFCSDSCRAAHHRMENHKFGVVQMTFQSWLDSLTNTHPHTLYTRAKVLQKIGQQLRKLPAYNNKA